MSMHTARPPVRSVTGSADRPELSPVDAIAIVQAPSFLPRWTQREALKSYLLAAVYVDHPAYVRRMLRIKSGSFIYLLRVKGPKLIDKLRARLAEHEAGVRGRALSVEQVLVVQHAIALADRLPQAKGPRWHQIVVSPKSSA